MRFRQDDMVYTTFAGSRSALVGKIVGFHPRDDGPHYMVSLSFTTNPKVMNLVLHEDNLCLTEECYYKYLIAELAAI